MPSKHTKNVVLTDYHMSFVEELMESGRYQNASEVMRDGLRALEDRLKREKAELAEIQDRIGRSLDQLDRGEYAEGTVQEVFDRAFTRAKDRRGV
jgi:antitoxin ParD1/3/4